MTQLRVKQFAVSAALVVKILLLASVPALAQQARIVKVKGRQAIVQFPADAKPEIGQILTVSSGVLDEENQTQNRNFLLAWDFNLSYVNDSRTNKATAGFSSTGRFGWNMGDVEFGPLGTLSFSSGSNTDSRTVSAGGFMDKNFVMHKGKPKAVYGLTGNIQLGQTTTTVSSATSSEGLLQLFGGGCYKWFGLSDMTALRGEAGLSVERHTSTGESYTLTGMVFRVGIQTYF